MTSAKKKFWTARLVFVLANAPVVLVLQLYFPEFLLQYLVWMSWLTWLSAELPTE